MAIHIQTSGSLQTHLPAGVTLTDVRTAGEAIERLRLPRDTSLVIMVNGRLADWSTQLHDGDVLQLVPAIGGG